MTGEKTVYLMYFELTRCLDDQLSEEFRGHCAVGKVTCPRDAPRYMYNTKQVVKSPS